MHTSLRLCVTLPHRAHRAQAVRDPETETVSIVHPFTVYIRSAVSGLIRSQGSSLVKGRWGPRAMVIPSQLMLMWLMAKEGRENGRLSAEEYTLLLWRIQFQFPAHTKCAC